MLPRKLLEISEKIFGKLILVYIFVVMGKEITVQTQVSQKELQIVEAIADGYTIGEVAIKRGVPPKEIQNIVDKLKSRFSCPNSTSLAVTFIRKKLIE
jgi:DNA-binding NarL/FixJ family response regulator